MRNLLSALAHLSFFLLASHAQAQSFVAYDQFILNQSHRYNLPTPTFWISHINTSSDGIRHRGGQLITNIPDTVSAFYDPTIKHNIKHFYQAQNRKLSVITGFSPARQWGVLTLGYDSGHRSKKLTIDQSYLIGYTNQLQLSKTVSLMASGYTWLGGEISETPCFDSFDREFSCLTLQPFSEYQGIDLRKDEYFLLELTKRF
jgi:hypothetical protein